MATTYRFRLAGRSSPADGIWSCDDDEDGRLVGGFFISMVIDDVDDADDCRLRDEDDIWSE